MVDAPPFQLGEMVVKTVGPFVGLAAAARLTIPGIPLFAERATTDLMRLADARGIAIVDPPVFVYTGACGDAASSDGTFLLQIVMPVAGDTRFDDAGPIALVRFEALRCASIQYTGPMTHIGDAYPLIVDAAHAMGCKLLEQSREVYRKWVAYDSAENVVEIQLGIQLG